MTTENKQRLEQKTTARAKDNGNSNNETGYGSVLAVLALAQSRLWLSPGFCPQPRLLASRLLPQPGLVLQNDKKQKQKQLWSS